LLFTISFREGITHTRREEGAHSAHELNIRPGERAQVLIAVTDYTVTHLIEDFYGERAAAVEEEDDTVGRPLMTDAAVLVFFRSPLHLSQSRLFA